MKRLGLSRLHRLFEQASQSADERDKLIQTCLRARRACFWTLVMFFVLLLIYCVGLLALVMHALSLPPEEANTMLDRILHWYHRGNQGLVYLPFCAVLPVIIIQWGLYNRWDACTNVLIYFRARETGKRWEEANTPMAEASPPRHGIYE